MLRFEVSSLRLNSGNKMIGKLLLPPKYEQIDGPLIFLAGPIQGATRWQDTAIKLINSYSSQVNIASPRRNEEYRKGDFTPDRYNEQVDWETFHLRRAAEDGAILFWLTKEAEHRCERAYAQTSRFELGEWKIRHERDKIKLALGIEDGFTNRRYITRRFSQDCPNITIFSSLEETCREAVRLVF